MAPRVSHGVRSVGQILVLACSHRWNSPGNQLLPGSVTVVLVAAGTVNCRLSAKGGVSS